MLKPALIYMKLEVQHLEKQEQNVERRAKWKTIWAYKKSKYEQKMWDSTKYRVIKQGKQLLRIQT